MHLSEGILPAAQAALWVAAASPFVAYSAATLRRRSVAAAPAEKALLSTGTALLFAATLLPIPIPVAGATSHLCVTPLLGLVLTALGCRSARGAVLLLQALFFGHGGLTTLGANTLTLGVAGPFVAAGFWWLLQRCRVPAPLAAGIACGVGQLSVYVADAGILGAALSGEKSFGFWAVRVLAGFAPVQLPLAVLEGVLSGPSRSPRPATAGAGTGGLSWRNADCGGDRAPRGGAPRLWGRARARAPAGARRGGFRRGGARRRSDTQAAGRRSR
jgi:cobalt/nickel transport system permease protein